MALASSFASCYAPALPLIAFGVVLSSSSSSLAAIIDDIIKCSFMSDNASVADAWHGVGIYKCYTSISVSFFHFFPNCLQLHCKLAAHCLPGSLLADLPAILPTYHASRRLIAPHRPKLVLVVLVIAGALSLLIRRIADSCQIVQ